MVTIRDASERERSEVMRLSFMSPGVGPEQAAVTAEACLSHARQTGLVELRQWVLEVGDRPAAAASLFHAPGRVGQLIVTSDWLRLGGPAQVGGLVDRVDRAARDWNLAFLQMLTETPFRDAYTAMLTPHGFSHLARLEYLEVGLRDARRPAAPDDGAPDVSWLPYSESAHDRFRAVIAASYRDSLDCPALTHRRSAEDALAGHRAAAKLRADRWWVMVVDGQDAGIVLLNELSQRAMLELAYMGLIPSARGRALGRVLLRQAWDAARRDGYAGLCAAVDSHNAPARRLYDEFGFQRSQERDAWIRIPLAVSCT
jgi:ribosomal protein S18 acetylase RimI-like enzyme